MKKIIAMMLAAVLCLGAFAGCSYSAVEGESEENEATSMFVRVEHTGYWQVLYHKETKVMYVASTGSYNSGNFVVMVNPDGTPQLWDGK